MIQHKDINDINLSLRYYNDGKDKHQSHEMHVDGILEAMEFITVEGFGYDKESAVKELKHNIDSYELYVLKVLRELEGIKLQLNNGAANDLQSTYK